MAIDLQAAQAFVEQHGSALQQARLRSLLGSAVPGEIPAELAALQNADGGFPLALVVGRPSSLADTAAALRILRDVAALDADFAQQALHFLIERQSPRGLWRESAELQAFPLPPWSDPESTAADIYTTALVASTLVLADDDELPVDLAVNWLQKQQARDGLLAGFKAHSSWLAVPAFVQIFGQETRATRRLIAGLGELLSAEWPGSMLAALLQSVLDAGYTRRTELVNRAWQMLQTAQQADGSVSADDEDDVVLATIQLVDVARRLGRRA